MRRGGSLRSVCSAADYVPTPPHLLQYHIGTLAGSLTPPPLIDSEAGSDPKAPFLEPRTWKSVTLTSIERMNHDSLVYRFALPGTEQRLGLPVGQHVFVRLKRKDTGEIVQRAYTPVSCENSRGSIDFLIKYVLYLLHGSTAGPADYLAMLGCTFPQLSFPMVGR